MTMDGKVVIVTGATSGIGTCMAEHFVAAGAKPLMPWWQSSRLR